jgi:hypothetical protein
VLKIGESQQQPQDARQFYLVVPAPTSVHGPPPPIATRVNAVEAAPSNSSQAAPSNSSEAAPSNSSEAAPSNSGQAAPSNSGQPSNSGRPLPKTVPGEGCASECHNAFSSCNLACDPAAKNIACKSCDPDYKKCMQRCFE